MTIIAARRYRNGQATACELLPASGRPGEGEFDWIGLVEPTPSEMSRVQQDYGLHPLAVEDALNQRQAAKAEPYGSQLFVVARPAARGEGDTIVYGQTAVFLSSQFIVTVRQGSARSHDGLREALEAHPERLAEGPDFVLHAVLDFIVDGYGPLLDDLERILGEMEDQSISAFPAPAAIRRIFHLRRALRQFEAVAGGMEEVAAKLAEVAQPAIDAGARPYFRDVFDHARRAVHRTGGLVDTLGSILEVSSLLEQSRTGAITRQLAAWAAILAVPTAIAGIYGMNFEFMPELSWRYGYPAVLGAIAAICALLFYRFRRIGWL